MPVQAYVIIIFGVRNRVHNSWAFADSAALGHAKDLINVHMVFELGYSYYRHESATK